MIPRFESIHVGGEDEYAEYDVIHYLDKEQTKHVKIASDISGCNVRTAMQQYAKQKGFKQYSVWHWASGENIVNVE